MARLLDRNGQYATIYCDTRRYVNLSRINFGDFTRENISPVAIFLCPNFFRIRQGLYREFIRNQIQFKYHNNCRSRHFLYSYFDRSIKFKKTEIEIRV